MHSAIKMCSYIPKCNQSVTNFRLIIESGLRVIPTTKWRWRDWLRPNIRRVVFQTTSNYFFSRNLNCLITHIRQECIFRHFSWDVLAEMKCYEYVWVYNEWPKKGGQVPSSERTVGAWCTLRIALHIVFVLLPPLCPLLHFLLCDLDWKGRRSKDLRGRHVASVGSRGIFAERNKIRFRGLSLT